jgi:outer membrane biosynthesis protein TonB
LRNPVMRKCWFLGLALWFIAASQSNLRPGFAQQADCATVLQAVPAIYSPIAVNARASGKLEVEVDISADGSVSSAHAVKPSILRPAAERLLCVGALLLVPKIN